MGGLAEVIAHLFMVQGLPPVPLLVSKVVALDGMGLVGVVLGPVLLLDRPQLVAPLLLDLAVVALRGQVVRMLQPGKTCDAAGTRPPAGRTATG